MLEVNIEVMLQSQPKHRFLSGVNGLRYFASAVCQQLDSFWIKEQAINLKTKKITK